MNERKICWARVLKNISYVLFPIFFTILVLLIVCLSYPLERNAIKKGLSYFETNTFAEDYAMEIFSGISAINILKDDNQQNIYTFYYVQTEQLENSNEANELNYYSEYKGNNVIWLIIDNKTKKAYTNLSYSIETSSIENIKNTIMQNQKHWNYHNGNIETTVSKLNNDNIEYIESGLRKESIEIIGESDYSIYTAVLDDLEYMDNISANKLFYDIMSSVNEKAMFLIPVLIILIIALVPIIIIGVGKTKKEEGIKLNWYDRILIEIAAFIAIFIGCIGACFTISISGMSTMASFILGISVMAVGFLIIYLACILFFETVVKRLKTHTLIKRTFAYWVYEKIKGFLSDIKITKKFILYFILFILANLICFGILWSNGFPGLVLTVILYIATYSYLSKRIKSYSKINETIHELYNGNTEIKLEENELVKEMQETGKEINDIAGGLSNAIEEKLKSERLKTELITNVSHDIKTPLTSIINYVDLLKKENIQGEKANEYLNILESKSQRLKKLTEDLVEASKASSGAIKLNMERLNVNELIKQVSGEFEDKFKAHDLQEIITFPENDVYINADSRYMYRVLENMYSNISKYAMEGTRVYTDIREENNKIVIQLKNVSKQKLNISADELMQRFVRGEASRNTEGSGLGLSIARSLTELQQGEFNIYLDGDLFKVTIEFEKK